MDKDNNNNNKRNNTLQDQEQDHQEDKAENKKARRGSNSDTYSENYKNKLNSSFGWGGIAKKPVSWGPPTNKNWKITPELEKLEEIKKLVQINNKLKWLSTCDLVALKFLVKSELDNRYNAEKEEAEKKFVAVKDFES